MHNVLCIMLQLNFYSKLRTHFTIWSYFIRNPRSFISNKTYQTSHNDSTLFRQPVLPTRPGHTPHIETYRLNMNSSRNKPNRCAKGRNSRMSKQVVVQRLLPLQPGITQPYSVLPTTDVNYPLENTMLKPSTSMEYKSILTEENLSRMNNLSDDTNSNILRRTFDHNSSNNLLQNIEENVSTNEHPNTDIGTCDLLDSVGDHQEHAAFDEIDIDEEENNRLRRRLNEDPDIASLMEMSLPSPIALVHSSDEFYTDGVDSQPPVSPMGILRESPVCLLIQNGSKKI